MALTSFRSIILAAAAVSMTFSTTNALSSYLTKIPNGSLFSQELGHPDNDSTKYTEFATAFADAGHEWTTELCNALFPGSEVKNGEAFGDPCCTWTVGATPDYTVTAFTDSPTSAGTCATAASGSTTASTAASGSAETTAASTAASTATSTASSTSEESSAYDTETEAPSAASSTESSAEASPSASYDTETEGSAESTASSTTEETEAPSAETPTSGGCRVKTSDSYSLRH